MLISYSTTELDVCFVLYVDSTMSVNFLTYVIFREHLKQSSRAQHSYIQSINTYQFSNSKAFIVFAYLFSMHR